MANITRVQQKISGSTGPNTDFEEVGSTAAGSTVYTKDIAQIQALPAYDTGLTASVPGGNLAPFLETHNSLFLMITTQLAYIFQKGIPDWEALTDYYVGSYVKKAGTGELYLSKTNANIGNALPAQTDNANWQYINLNPIPTGVLLDFGGSSAPSGYLLCDGSAVSRTDYANLFSAIGTNFGSGDGFTTFNVPDFRRRVAVGSGGSGTGTLGNAVGNSGGEENHTMTTGELVSHAHGYNKLTSVGSGGNVVISGGSSWLFQTGQLTDGSGGSTPFNIIQPSLVVTKIIKI